MSRKSVLIMILIFVHIGMSVVVLKIEKVKASGIIYIRADGSIAPSTAPISTVDNVTYTFTDNINNSIVVERDNVSIDGAGYNIRGTDGGAGIDLTERSNVTIRRIGIELFHYGIYLYNSSNNKICWNNITNNKYGIKLIVSSFNAVSENHITNNEVHGISLGGSSNNTLWGNHITNNEVGLFLLRSYDNIISENNITNNEEGIELNGSSSNTISRNNIRESWNGIGLIWYTDNNTISGNNITNNNIGVWFHHGFFYKNKFYHNNFIDNTKHRAGQVLSTGNFWDNGYPSCGNYWSDYTGGDSHSGPDQNETGSDGIGDDFYEVDITLIDAHIIDHYPLMGMFHSFNTSLDYHVDVISNSAIEDFEYLESSGEIKMYVSNMTADQTYGFCRLTIPHDLLSPPYNLSINSNPVTHTIVYENETHSVIYFRYEHSRLEIVIIPEFPSFIIMPLFMTATLLSVIGYRRKKHN